MILLDTLSLNPTKRRPVWIMRQAGRYLASYRKIRETKTFKDMSENADLATKVSLLPLKQYELDASIVFSDILIPLNKMGVPLEFTEKGPVLEPPENPAALEKLKIPFDPNEKTPVILETIKNLRSEVSTEIAVLGFAGAPFTMLCYLLEGKLSPDLKVVKTWMAKEPKAVHAMLDYLSEVMGDYLDAQAHAGANAVQLFDTWASQLSPADFDEFALPYARKTLSAVSVPCLYYINGVSGILEQMASVGSQGISVDWRIDIGEVRRRVSPVIAIQGNLDPYHLKLSKDQIRNKTHAIMQAYGDGPGLIMNLGHGIVPTIPEDGVKYFIEAIHEYR